ncbi:MAG: phosphatidylserine decarboxylase [Candidatus Omnitrophica bacterium]|nr:phosphatidylserine decarboxylase [Candidatus Omnitrophota bacterium]
MIWPGRSKEAAIRNIFKAIHIAYEARYVLLAALSFCLAFCLIFPDQRYIFIAACALLLLFFRDPARDIPDDPFAIVAPADGRIADIDIVRVEELGKEFLRIGIYLSIFDVHVQRLPYNGEIEKVEYKKGRFHIASGHKAAVHNESNTVAIKTECGAMLVKQICGSIVRRIVCNVAPRKMVTKGERLGMIMFGSRVELYISPRTELLVGVGDKVAAGQTFMGRCIVP